MNNQITAQGRTLLERHAKWWQRKESLFTTFEGKPLGSLWLPLADGSLAQEDMLLTPDALDFERLVGPQYEPEPIKTYGNIFQTAAPYGVVPWVEAVLGTPIQATIQGGSMRTMAFIDTWSQWEALGEHFHQEWFSLLVNLTKGLVQRSAGQFAVTQPTMRGPCDLSEAVLGPELMSFSMYDHPDSLCKFLDEATAVFIKMLREMLAVIPPLKDGYVSPFGIWAPGTVVRTQCDATAFLSPKQYADWFLPYDVRICDSFDYSIIHLHSVSLHTVDAILAVERPHAIQVTLETSPPGPSLEAMIPVFKRILEVKPLLLEGKLSQDEIHQLQDNLPGGGLAITARRAAW